MIFNKHSKLVALGAHAFLSASKYSWVNYDEHKLDAAFRAAMAAQRGTALHKLAHDLIKHGQNLPDTPTTMNMYVNDAIGFRMNPEQPLFYSENCFGTVDAISFRENMLRIHDLKTGISPASFKQLEVYAAIFCLEYDVSPLAIDIELRIYQRDAVETRIGDPVDISLIMDKIITFDKYIRELREEEYS